jgi:hypothetical protein
MGFEHHQKEERKEMPWRTEQLTRKQTREK